MLNLNCIKCTMLPQRIVFSIMGFLAVVVSLAMRSCLSIAITEMVVPVDNTGKGNESIICPVDLIPFESTEIAETTGTRYNWTQEQQGWILSAFYAGYLLSHIPGALLAQKFGGKWTLSIGIFVMAICNAVTPQALEYGEQGALVLIIILRVLMGLASGPMFPTFNVLIATWIPQKERGRHGTFIFSGAQIGNFVSLYVSGIMLSYWSWPVVFYFWSSISVVWFIAFTILCYSDPESHPFITKEESDYLEMEIGQLKRGKNLPQTPWIDILTSVPVIVYIISHVGADWFYHVLATDLPKYMVDVIGFSVRDVGLYSSLPSLLMWIVTISSGAISDVLINRRYLTLLQTRKLFATLSAIFPSIFLVAVSYAGCDRALVVTYLIISMGFFGNCTPGVGFCALELGPNYAGSIYAIANGLGAVIGVIVPIFIGIVTPDSTLEQWRFVFWITFVIGVFRNIVHLIWGSAEVQPWNDPKNRKSKSQINSQAN